MEKIKQFITSEKGKDILIVLIVILVGLGSFELGRLSKQNDTSGLKIEYTDQYGKAISNQSANIISSVPSTENQTSGIDKSFFASSRGSKYYSLGCSAGKTIKQENRVYFATAEQAEQAGYTLSTSCN
ncbi:MAG: Ada metal-binding domain-containing protein [Candidatus Paceibacterota bacterium]